MSKKDKLKKIFDSDSFNLLNSAGPAETVKKPEDKRLIESFEEISNFFEEHNREPNSTGIAEFKLFARLKAIRENPTKVKTLTPYDYYQLLDSNKYKSIGITEIIGDDPLGILNSDENDNTIFNLKNVKKSDRIRPDYLARRKKCKDFDKYQELFNCIHSELLLKQRKLIQFKSIEIEIGKFYVLNGIILYLEECNAIENQIPYKSGERIRLDGRTRCIFDNGTESTMLLRSLIKALEIDGFSISEIKNLNTIEINETDEANGSIYILKSKSPNTEILKKEHLFKIGYSKGDVTNRIKNAKIEPTYLLADVELVSVFRCFNMSTNKFESAIHSFFNEVRLNIEIADFNGNKHRPREWFIAPLEIIEEAINLLVKNDINNFFYNHEAKCIVFKNK
jgi:hypothetical protein